MTPESVPSDPRAPFARQLDQALAAATPNPIAICQLGNAAYKLGLEQEARRAFEFAVALLHRSIDKGDADAALAIEGAIFQGFVKVLEDEDHYELCFSHWRDALAGLGRRFRDDSALPAGAAIAFVFHAGVVLGHTEVLFRLLESRDRAVDVRIYVLGSVTSDFAARARALGVAVESFETSRWGAASLGLLPRIRWLRERAARDAVGTVVWVSYPGSVIFAFAMRIARVQVMWSLRYHPVRLPEIDGYITYGSWAEDERTFHGQRWTVCPVPLALDPRPARAEQVTQLRARFPEQVLLGTLAREEKIDSEPFLESVAQILERNPQCGFVWTGHELHPRVAGFFARRGVAGRCHFVGWVDTPLYAAMLDVFLETFPLGCGITGYQAMGAGVPLVSYLDANTIFGMQYWSELMREAGSPEAVTREMLESYPVLVARNPPEYVEIASRLVTDADFRAEWKARESRFYRDEIDHIERYSKRFFAALDAIRHRAAAA